MNHKEEKKRKPVKNQNFERDFRERNQKTRPNGQQTWKHINVR